MEVGLDSVSEQIALDADEKSVQRGVDLLFAHATAHPEGFVVGKMTEERDMQAQIESLKVGDVVKLRSGGPGMTIVEIDDGVATDGSPSSGKVTAKCLWFAEPYMKGDCGEEYFPVLALEKVR